jgi:putative endonuclease
MKLLGSEGEAIAVQFLKKQGYTIIAHNYKTRIGEIDIIAKDDETIVFVEVKTRSDDAFCAPYESVNTSKRQKIKNVASLYLQKQKKEFPARFDVISITCRQNGQKAIRHIKDAFEE